MPSTEQFLVIPVSNCQKRPVITTTLIGLDAASFSRCMYSGSDACCLAVVVTLLLVLLSLLLPAWLLLGLLSTASAPLLLLLLVPLLLLPAAPAPATAVYLFTKLDSQSAALCLSVANSCPNTCISCSSWCRLFCRSAVWSLRTPAAGMLGLSET